MTGLDSWLIQATRHLSKDSAAQVRSEIQEHYESAREAAMSGGASAGEADRLAVTALGDANLANRQYRSVLLTAAEARMLGRGNRDARALCSRPWLRRLLLAVSLASLLGAAVFSEAALLVVGMGTGFLFAAPWLPVYTPSRARVFRCVKWVLMGVALVLAFGADPLKWSWLLFSCLWPFVWIEWTRASIRRKLPVEKWPRQLYF